MWWGIAGHTVQNSFLIFFSLDSRMCHRRFLLRNRHWMISNNDVGLRMHENILNVSHLIGVHRKLLETISFPPFKDISWASWLCVFGTQRANIFNSIFLLRDNLWGLLATVHIKHVPIRTCWAFNGFKNQVDQGKLFCCNCHLDGPKCNLVAFYSPRSLLAVFPPLLYLWNPVSCKFSSFNTPAIYPAIVSHLSNWLSVFLDAQSPPHGRQSTFFSQPSLVFDARDLSAGTTHPASKAPRTSPYRFSPSFVDYTWFFCRLKWKFLMYFETINESVLFLDFFSSDVYPILLRLSPAMHIFHFLIRKTKTAAADSIWGSIGFYCDALCFVLCEFREPFFAFHTCVVCKLLQGIYYFYSEYEPKFISPVSIFECKFWSRHRSFAFWIHWLHFLLLFILTPARVFVAVNPDAVFVADGQAPTVTQAGTTQIFFCPLGVDPILADSG